MEDWFKGAAQAAAFVITGIAIGLGQLLLSPERLTRRIMFGRALSTGGIAMGAGAVLVWFPDLPFLGLLGIAAMLASLGTSALERIFQRFLGKEGA